MSLDRMILVTGAAGKTGRAVVNALSTRGQAIRVWVRDPTRAAAFRDLAVQEIVSGDMRDSGVWVRAVRDIEAVYHLCPNVSPYEEEIGALAVEAAQGAGVRHVVYHSVLHPQTEDMPHHWHKLRVEERLLKSGLAFTILQPCAYMQNLLAQWGAIREEGVFRVPYSVETRLSLVDLEDVAEAAAIVITEPGHEGATYELAGPDAPTQLEVASVFAGRLRRPVRAEPMGLDDWERGARGSRLAGDAVETLLAMFRYYDRFGLVGNAQVLTWLLGRRPSSLADFVDRLRE